jgi:hypothetical protein
VVVEEEGVTNLVQVGRVVVVTDVRVERVQKDKVIKVVLPQLKETNQVVEEEVGVPVILVEMATVVE